jgi:sigma-B regulation protein RsbU (phosphoserine phosphatase)
MDMQDLSQNRRIASLTKLTQELEQSQSPKQTLLTLQRSFTEAYGFSASVLLSTRGLPQGQYRVIQMRLEDNPDSPGQVPREPAPVQFGGIMAAIIDRREPQLIQEVDWTSDPFFHDTLQGYASVIAIPLVGDHLPMTWAIVLQRRPGRFTVFDLETAMERTVLVGSLLDSQALAGQLARANERIDRDARLVGELQRSLMPAQLPQIAGLEIAVSYEPSDRAGGDLYDFFPLDAPDNDAAARLSSTPSSDEASAPKSERAATPDRWCVIIGDATGHGLAAAVVMAIVQSALHAHPAGMTRPVELLAHVNRQLCRKHIGGFFTAFLGIYEPATRRLTYANAGHPPPLLKRSSDRAMDAAICPLAEALSYPLGIDLSATYQEATVQLQPGDIVLLYTDGITEARDAHGDLFEQDRLTRVFQDGGDRPAEIIERLRESVRAHEQGQAAARLSSTQSSDAASLPKSQDDQTLVAARAL